MKFQTKYKVRRNILVTLSIFYSATAILIVYSIIKWMKFNAYQDWILENPDYRFIPEMNVASWDFKSDLITNALYLLPITLGLDLGIRYLFKLFEESKQDSN